MFEVDIGSSAWPFIHAEIFTSFSVGISRSWVSQKAWGEYMLDFPSMSFDHLIMYLRCEAIWKLSNTARGREEGAWWAGMLMETGKGLDWPLSRGQTYPWAMHWTLILWCTHNSWGDHHFPKWTVSPVMGRTNFILFTFKSPEPRQVLTSAWCLINSLWVNESSHDHSAQDVVEFSCRSMLGIWQSLLENHVAAFGVSMRSCLLPLQGCYQHESMKMRL